MFSRRTTWSLAPNQFSLAVDRLRAAGKPLLDLTVSNPTSCGLHYDEPTILTALSSGEALQYSPDAQGLLAAREAVAAYYAALAKPARVNATDVILTTSTSEAYSYGFRLLCDPNDAVLIPRPGYPLFDFLAAIQDVKAVPYPLLYDHGWQIDMPALEAAITERTRAIVVVHPNNPTGSFVSRSEAEQLSQLCSRHDLALIADEVFLDYGLQEEGTSFATNTGCLTLTLSGLSKIAGLPQMKVAWMVVSGPDEAKRQALSRLEVIADTYLSMNTPLQVATPRLLALRHEFQRQLRLRLVANLRELDAQLAASSHCSRLEVHAGWYAVLRVPAVRSDEELAIKLMEEQSVVVHPGHFFDFVNDGYLVLSLMTPEADFREGVKRILRALG